MNIFLFAVFFLACGCASKGYTSENDRGVHFYASDDRVIHLAISAKLIKADGFNKSTRLILNYNAQREVPFEYLKNTKLDSIVTHDRELALEPISILAKLQTSTGVLTLPLKSSFVPRYNRYIIEMTLPDDQYPDNIIAVFNFDVKEKCLSKGATFNIPLDQILGKFLTFIRK